MANALEDMRARLRVQLADTDDIVWDAGEKDDLLTWAVRRLNQRINRPLDPNAAAQQITLVAATYFYAIDAGITHVNMVELNDTNGDQYGEITGWRVTGSLVSGTAKMQVSPHHVVNLGTLIIHGYGRFTLPTASASQTSAIPDDYVTLVLALARSEALRRMAVNRVQFAQWQVHNQVENVSVNELMQMISEADGQAQDEWSLIKVWQTPVEARQ